MCDGQVRLGNTQYGPPIAEVLIEVLLADLPWGRSVGARHALLGLEDSVVEGRRATQRIHSEELVRYVAKTMSVLVSRMCSRPRRILVEAFLVDEGTPLDMVLLESLGDRKLCLVGDSRKTFRTSCGRRGRGKGEERVEVAIRHDSL